MMEWVRKIACAFGFHNYIPIREEWFLYREQEKYIENQSYLKQGENIVSVLFCPHCKKRIEITVES